MNTNFTVVENDRKNVTISTLARDQAKEMAAAAKVPVAVWVSALIYREYDSFLTHTEQQDKAS